MNNNYIPPTINYHTKDPDRDLNYTPNTPIETSFDTAMSNSFGFGDNAVVIAKSFLINALVLAGVDEAGRGALAGPVVACAVTLKSSFTFGSEVNDSKQLTASKRHQLLPLLGLISILALAWRRIDLLIHIIYYRQL